MMGFSFAAYKKYFISGGIFVAILLSYFLITGYIADIRRLDKAEADKATTQAATKAREDEARKNAAKSAETQKALDAMTAAQAALKKDTDKRATQYTKTTTEIKSKTSTDDIIKQLQEVLKIAATNAGNNQVTMPAEQAQGYTLLKLELDRTKADLADLRASFVLEQQKRAEVEADRDRAYAERDAEKALREKWQKIAAEFEAAAKKSKLRRFLEAAKPAAINAGITVATILIARQYVK